MSKVRRALVSVYDKTDLVPFVQGLVGLDVEIISTGGTARLLRENHVPVVPVSEYTGFPEILSGRVKTLHPKIHGGILALRDLESQMSELEQYEIEPIDMVVANLYPFLEAIRREEISESELLEQIDIGGPTMIRSAAKNYPHVVVVTNPDQYAEVLTELTRKGGEISVETSRKLAVEAFRKTAHYDGMIAQYFSRRFGMESPAFPQHLALTFDHTYALRYGENPHQKAGYYQDDLTSAIRGIEQVNGIALSYNNIVDVDAAVGLIAEFTERPTVAIIKHTNPCGVGMGDTLLEAYEKANATDPVSSFGSIICVNRRLDLPIAEKLRHHFVEVLLAPDFDLDALALLQEKKKLRILKFSPTLIEEGAFRLRSALGGLLVQQADRLDLEEAKLRVVTERKPSEEEWRALRFAWKVVKHVKSNAIVFTDSERTLGIGAGQMSRVDSAELAIKKAQNAGLDLRKSVVASDAFFPFRDGLDVAAKAGARAVIQPGGSIRDEEVIQAANEHKVAMVLTGIRHFRH